MKLVHLDDLPWETWSSPRGTFRGRGREISWALGAIPDAPQGAGGHPFDLEFGVFDPGMTGCPFHTHSSQWELFVIHRGEGVVRHGASRTPVRAGDAVLHPPGPEAHQLINTGGAELEYFLIADNPAVDVWHYPDSAKWGYRPDGGYFRKQPVAYYLGEEEGVSADAPQPTLPEPTEAQRARFVTVSSIPEETRLSPKGRFGSHVRDISLALGGIRDVGTWGGGHPFDLQLRRVSPGRTVCPRHSHAVQWELFFVLEGAARVRSGDEQHDVIAGHAFLQPPGTAHQILNTGAGDLLFYVIADNPPTDTCYYPDSDKWMIRTPRKCFRMQEVDYLDGEE